MVTVALITAIPPTCVALFGLIVSLKNSKKADVITAKADEAAVKQQEIHVLVNSNLTAVKDDLEEAKAEIQALRTLVTQLTKEPA